MGDRRCQGCSKSLLGEHGRRKWCSELCRKRTLYGGECQACGRKTDGSGGREQAPELCDACSRVARKLWDRPTIVYSIERWAGRYGVFPTADQWRSRSAQTKANHLFQPNDEWPVTSVVQEAFGGSWARALRAAGAATVRPGRRPAALSPKTGAA